MTPLEWIYPSPRELWVLPGGGPLREVLRTRIERTEGEYTGAYSISFDGTKITARAHDGDGEHSARSVLRQLAAHEGSECPAFELRDWPRFATRGFMLDISRNRVPTMDSLRNLVGVLSTLRMNHLQLYTEHAFAYRGHEAVWRDASPMTADEIRELDRLCAEHGITLAANQNCFGHLSEWLKHPEYAHLAETHGPYDFYGITRDGPFSLCPTDDRSLALVEDLIGQLRACFSSRMLNIGCDETADVGTGRSRQAVRDRGKGAVYAEFVSKIARVAESHGFEPMFWADIALASPETLDLLPSSLKPLAWGYEPDSPFSDWDAALRGAGRRGWVCPGTSCWRSFAGRTVERRGNLDAATAPDLSFDGILVTAWGDVGHQQQWPITLHALGDAAHAAWHGGANPHPGAASRLLFGSPDLGPWLDELGDADQHIRSDAGDTQPSDTPSVLRNASALFNELYPANPALPPRGSLSQWSECTGRLRLLRESQSRVGELVDDELRWTIEMSLLACRVAIARRSDRADEALVDDLARAEAEYRRLWSLRSRPGGLVRSTAHIDGLARSLEGSHR